MTPSLLRILPLLSLLAFTGCTQTLLVNVDGYAVAEPVVKPGKYLLTSGNIRVPEGDLQYQSHAAQLAGTLGAAGWTRVSDKKDAATLIRFRWSVSDPLTEIHEYDTPEYGVNGYHLTQTKETSSGTAGATTVTRATMTPSYGRTGTTRHTDARVSYGMTLVIEAYDLAHPAADGTPPQIWKTIVTTRDSHGDLRTRLPDLLAAATPHLGTDTHGIKKIEITPTPVR